MASLISTEYFPSFQDSEGFYQRITAEKGAGGRVVRQLLLAALLAFVYGVVMGSYHGVAQAIATGVKVPVLFVLALLICFPAIFIIQTILGSKLRFLPMISVILSGFVLAAAVMVSFTPIVIIFLLTGSNYYFLQLLHIAIVGISGAFGMKVVVDALKYSCEQRKVYPQTGVVVFRFWLVILAFVGIQLAWNFRPFLGDRGQPFQLFREYEGNFYTAVIYSVGQLIRNDTEEQPVIRWDDVQAQPAAPDSAGIPSDIRDSLFGN
ncbi:MAG TPA: hypothetical protein VM118_13830 [Acidobacteriota bacterium]|nr:hypothetical protein [Acidobacteriota bacterium]